MTIGKRGHQKATLLLVAASFALTHLLFLLFGGVFDSWNAQVFDRLLAYRAASARFQPAYDETIVHTDITNAGLQNLGEFYLNRAHFAQEVRNLGRMNVAAQVYDFIFAVPQSVAEDTALIDATREARNTYYGVAFALSSNAERGTVNPKVEDYLRDTAWRIKVEGDSTEISAGINPLMTFPDLASVSHGLGSITIEPDPDGVIRRFPLIMRYGDAFYPSLPLRAVCDYLKVTPDRIVLHPGRSLTLRAAGDIAIPIDSRGFYRINFIGTWERMKHYDFAAIYRASEDRDALDILREQLMGKIVVVSDVSALSRDVGPVPTDPKFPLSGLLTNVMHNILTNSFLRELTRAEQFFVDVLLLAAVFMCAVWLSPSAFAGAVVVLVGSYLGLVLFSFLYAQMVFHVVRPVLMLSFFISSDAAYRYIVEEREKGFLRRSFEAYFPPKVVERLMVNPNLIAAAGERKELTVMFSDLVGFTRRSSTLAPDRIQALLNEYFEAMVDIVFRYEGTVDKYMGDGLMVFFGDPEPQPDHALRCVRMAIDMQKRIRELSLAWVEKGEPPLQARIGINSGVVVVGNMGSARRLSYTVLGADVNLAQRFESNAPLGGILISARTNELLGGTIPTRSLGQIKVKGLDDPVEAYEVPVD